MCILTICTLFVLSMDPNIYQVVAHTSRGENLRMSWKYTKSSDLQFEVRKHINGECHDI